MSLYLFSIREKRILNDKKNHEAIFTDEMKKFTRKTANIKKLEEYIT